MKLLIAIGLNGNNCLLDATDDVKKRFDHNLFVGFIDQPTKPGVYLVDVSNSIPDSDDEGKYFYTGSFKLIYHPEILQYN